MQITDEMLALVKESFRTMTTEEFDELMEEMIHDGIMDRTGRVLLSARVPDGLPDWAKPANGHTAVAEPKKPKRRRKTT